MSKKKATMEYDCSCGFTAVRKSMAGIQKVRTQHKKKKHTVKK